MKIFNKFTLRLIICTLLVASLSACTTNRSEALYHNPTGSSYSIYGYKAVDFDALGME